MSDQELAAPAAGTVMKPGLLRSDGHWRTTLDEGVLVVECPMVLSEESVGYVEEMFDLIRRGLARRARKEPDP